MDKFAFVLEEEKGIRMTGKYNKKRIGIVLFAMLFGCFITDILGQSIQDTLSLKQGNGQLRAYEKRRFIDEKGDEIVAVSVPGKPPANYRAPKAKIPLTARTIANVPAYDWSFGCTATSAAMIAGYYDNIGYPNLYTGPTNGGVAPMTNSSWGSVVINGELRSLCPISATMNGLDGRSSRGHVDDYWIKYNNCGSDPYITNGWAQHSYDNCTGDFMKTNQSAYDNCDGATSVYYNSAGYQYTGTNADDGIYGFQLFFQSRGYTVTTRYTQLIYGYNGNTRGFTFTQYKQEIDNGYPVFIQVDGHTMVGIGYDDATNKVYLHDTWDYGTHEMTWGGSYSGLAQWAVSVIHLAPAPITYTISTTASPVAGGLVSGGGSYNSGQTATVTATANAGYSFVNWTEGGVQVSANSAYSFTVTANRNLVANFSINSYSISTSSNPTSGGTTSGGGTYTYGQTVQVQAAANTGYVFTKWTENGVQVSTNSLYQFTASANRNLVANFSPSSCTITTSSNPSSGGTTTGSGTFTYGQLDTVKAAANAGYTFVNWTENGTVVSTNQSYGFTVTASRNLIANFSLNSYVISTSSNPSSGGATTGGGTFTYGQPDTVKATANAGYTFANWTENGTVVSTNQSYGFTVTASRNLIANFSTNTYTVSTISNPAAGGTTTGGGIFTYGQQDTVKAAANPGYTFVNWTENSVVVSTNPNFGFTVISNRTLTANYSANSYTVATNSNPAAGGTTSGGGTFSYGQSDTVKASANAGYMFINWTENGSVVSANPNYGFVVLANRNLTANFQLNTYVISTASNPSSGGTTTGNGTLSYGQIDTIKANANTGYTFANWTENGTVISVNPNFVFTVTSNRNFIANFTLNSYVISTGSIPSSGGTTSGSGNFNYGQTDTVKAIANTGYTFVNWTENGAVVSTSSNYIFTVTSGRNLIANFNINSYIILTSSSPASGGTTSGGGTFNYGQADTVKAAANTGYSFVNWTENGVVVSSSSNYVFTVTSNRNLVANFALTLFTVATSCNPPGGGTTSGSGSFTYGQVDSVKAVPNPGYTFVYWTENGSIVSTDAVYIFTVTASRNLIANFSTDLYSVYTHSNPLAGGNTSGNGVFSYGQPDTVRATVNNGYYFVNWTENGIPVSSNPVYAFAVTTNRDLTANFARYSYTVSTASDPVSGGTTSGGGSYFYGESTTLKALPVEGYKFISWLENGTVVSSSSEFTLTVTSNRTFTASFARSVFAVAVINNPANGGTATGAGNFVPGTIDTAKANPINGFIFTGWTDNGITLSLNPVYVFTVNSDRTLTANYSYLNITAPLGGDTLKTGTVRNIAWSTINIQNVKIEYSTNNGFTWSVIAAQVPASQGSYAWTVPNSPALNYRIRLSDSQNSSVFKTTSIPFAIVNESLYAWLSLNTVNGSSGDSVTITMSGKNLAKIGALSLKIKFDSTKLSFGRLINIDSQLTGIIAGGSAGSVGISWFNTFGADFADNKMFDLKFLYKGSIDPAAVTFYVNECDVTDINFSILPAKYTNGSVIQTKGLYGKLVYANSSSTPMSNVKVYLKNPDTVVDSSITDASGAFSFTNKSAGTYRFGFNITKPWGGANATDALLIARNSAMLYPFDTLQMKAADVNGSGYVNSTDAFAVMRRNAGLVPSFVIGDWVYEEPVLTLAGNNINQTVRCLSAGDVNASYSSIPAKEGNGTNIVFSSANLYSGSVIDLPIILNSTVEIGAADLCFNYDLKSVEIIGIESCLPGMIYNIEQSKILVAWADINGVKIKNNEAVLKVKARLLKTVDQIILTSSYNCEFADKTGKIIDGLLFGSAKLNASNEMKYELTANYPNPFNPSTAIKFTIPEDNTVTLIIYDMLGREIKTLVNNEKKAGSYTITWHGDDNCGRQVSSGTYIYRLSAGGHILTYKMQLMK